MRFISYRSGNANGMACGIDIGPFFGEAMFYDEDGNSTFVLASQIDCSLMVSVSEYSLFDIEYNAFIIYESNFDNEMDKAIKLKKKEHNFKFDDEDEVNNYGKEFPGFEKAVNFSVKLLLKDFDGKLTQKDLENLLGENIEDLDI